MDHSTHIPLAPEELNVTNLEGAAIYDSEDNKIGSVSHMHGAGPHAQIIVDVGGFLGIGAKPVALPLTELHFMRDNNGSVHATTAWSKDALKDLPEHHHV
ncbi:PRC-barrel domain-containing protein [Paracoccaceae bacterium Fryx2]|nr:PRC-barrel domain-containing protein [Paracoccaceae bacterium Fryx2]